MLTLEETLKDQEKLDELCQDRELKTSEIFQPNDFYGVATILKEYAGMANNQCLKAVVPHGVRFDDHLIWEAERRSLFPTVFCYPPYRCRIYEELTNMVSIPSASPFLYVIKLLKEQSIPERKGTIFIPNHSTHHITVQMDYEQLAHRLSVLGGEYQPVTVCLYWKDYNLGVHKPFEKKGFKIVSAGHIFDSKFLFRFYHLCSLHKYAASNFRGSHLFYSVKSGCSYFHLDSDFSIIAERAILERDTSQFSKVRRAEIIEMYKLFSNPIPGISQEQLEVVDYYLGVSHLKSPEELRKQIMQAEKLDKFGFFVRDRNGGIGFMFPPYYWRFTKLLILRLLNQVKVLIKKL